MRGIGWMQSRKQTCKAQTLVSSAIALIWPCYSRREWSTWCPTTEAFECLVAPGGAVGILTADVDVGVDCAIAHNFGEQDGPNVLLHNINTATFVCIYVICVVCTFPHHSRLFPAAASLASFNIESLSERQQYELGSSEQNVNCYGG